ncbi:MAG: YegP family protein [Saprospiraceae bacterium]
MAKFEVTRRKNGEFQFNLKANNGEIILTSEGYSRRPSCLNGIASVQKNSQDESRFDLKTAKNEKVYFNLIATNGQIIGTSEMYDDNRGRTNGKKSVMKNAPGAKVEDLS